MAYPYGIGPNPYVISFWTSNLTQKCMHKSFVKSPKMTSKSGYWSLLPCANLRGDGANPFRTINFSPEPLCMHFSGP